MIPVLGVAILNQPELLVKMIDSIDADIGRIVVIDNGSLFDLSQKYDHLDVVQPGHNLGVSAAWNLVMRSSPLAPWWLIVNHDIEFGAGDLARLLEAVEPRRPAIYHLLGFAAFAMTAPALGLVGYFDENFHPAYDEDLDMARRCHLAGVPRIEVGFSGSHVGSATIYADALLRVQNGRTHTANDAYYARKWGGHKEGGETFSTPFNRGGHVGEWRLEPERLRDQAWRQY